MNRVFLRLCVLLTLVIFCLVALGTAHAQGPGERRALLIGIDRYADTGRLTPFPGGGADAEALEKVLVSSLGFPDDEDHIHILTPNSALKPTRAEFRRAIEWLNQKVGPNDTLIVYFAGHAVEIGTDTYLLPSDANPARDDTLALSSQSATDFLAAVGKLRARTKVLGFDIARTEPLVGAGGTSKPNLISAKTAQLLLNAPQSPNSSMVTLLAGAVGQRAYGQETPPRGHLALALEEIGKQAGPTAGRVRLSQLAEGVRATMAKFQTEGNAEEVQTALTGSEDSLLFAPVATAKPKVNTGQTLVEKTIRFAVVDEKKQPIADAVVAVNGDPITGDTLTIGIPQGGVSEVRVAADAPGYIPSIITTVSVSSFADDKGDAGKVTVALQIIPNSVSTLYIPVIDEEDGTRIAGATVFLDDVPLQGPPYKVDLKDKPNRTGRLRIEVPGFDPWEGPVRIRRSMEAILIPNLRPFKKTAVVLPAIKVNPKDGATMILVPAGEFLMGSKDGDEDEQMETQAGMVAPFKAHLSAYYIYKHPITVAMYRKFCEETGRAMPTGPREFKFRDDNPMTLVKWQDAMDYAAWAGGTLPSEAQWEKAARGTDGRTYPWGNEFKPAAVKFVKSVQDILKATPPDVGAQFLGASVWGVQDLVGVVNQWCLDLYDEVYSPDLLKASGLSIDAQAPTSSRIGNRLIKDQRVVRGGAYNTLERSAPKNFRASNRSFAPPDSGGTTTGFRVVCPAVL